MSSPALQRTIAPNLGPPADLDEGLQTLAQLCACYLSAYAADERDNAFVWAGAIGGLTAMLRELAWEATR